MRARLTRFFRRYFFLAAALVALLPFVVLARYSHPALDDFGIANHLHHKRMATYLAEVYGHKSGRYAATLSSVVIQYFGWHPAAYPGLILAGLLALVAGLYAAAAAATPAGHPRLAASIGSVLVVAVLLNFPSPAEGIYWLTGEVAYLYPVVLLALLVAVLAWLAAHPGARGRNLAWGAAVVLAAFIPGFSEITALLLPLVALGLLAVRGPRRVGGGWWAVVAAALAGSALTLLSAAHYQHMQVLTHALGVGRAAGLAAVGTAYSLVNWLGNGLLPLWLLLAAPLSRAYSRAAQGTGLVQQLTQRVALWPLLVLAGLWLGFFLCYVGTAMGPALRVKDLLYLYFVAGTVLATHAAYRRLGARPQALLLAAPVRVGLGVWLLAAFLSDHNTRLMHAQIGQGYNAVAQAYCDWLSGDAARYDQQQRARVALLRATPPAAAPLHLGPLQTLPPTLFYADISAEPTLWGNVVYAAFYGYPAVYVMPETARPAAP